MSIINDALKKAQQGLNPQGDKAKDAQAKSPWATENYEATPPVEQLPTPKKNKIKTLINNACIIVIATAITIASISYILQQFQSDIPRVKTFAQTSINKFMNKKGIKPKPPAPKPLAQLTLNPAATGTASLTLNVHGIMSSNGRNVALINDQVYQEGDEIDGTKIVKINLDSITVNTNGTEKTILVKS
jgi:type II secretory pathway component PulC